MNERKKPVRVSKAHRCPACGKDSWCMIGEAWVLCMRSASDRPKLLASGETGWLHPVGDSPKPPVVYEAPAPILNISSILKQWRSNGRTESNLPTLSAELGVGLRALECLEATRAPYHHTWAFPMRYGDNTYCGIRLRNDKGEKWAERGSHSGLFIPQCPPQPTVFLTEGPTDTAAALTLGFFALGRPSCSGGLPHIQVALKRSQARRAVIVADLDDPGLRGAKTLQEHLSIPTAILVPPAKDLRTAVRAGITREMVDCMISQLLWTVP